MAKYQIEDEPMTDNTNQDDFFSTPELEVPATPPDAHRATINSVTFRKLNNDKGTRIITVNLTSRDVPTIDEKFDIFVPGGFGDAAVAAGSKFNPSELPEELGNKQQSGFRRSFANSDKTATLQKLVFNPDSVARAAGRDPRELGLTKPVTMEEYVENLNKMLQGLEVIMTRRERGGDDPAFAHQLQVRDIFSADEYERNPKRFKNYQLAWEQQ